uniref:Uncharacterized protein n=1 Tax=uncultured marine virus TaxID=186617 RepID=A0A0F7L6X8_9VIRU|nr:hypothetical protein [uncultured marine virus]
MLYLVSSDVPFKNSTLSRISSSRNSKPSLLGLMPLPLKISDMMTAVKDV